MNKAYRHSHQIFSVCADFGAAALGLALRLRLVKHGHPRLKYLLFDEHLNKIKDKKSTLAMN